MHLWGGRFTKEMNATVLKFTSSLEVDRRLWKADLAGSRAHVKMLGQKKILMEAEVNEILSGLNLVENKIEKGEISLDGPFEDIHSLIESALYEQIGKVAGKLHMARSRNDQVLTSFKLYLREETEALKEEIIALQKALIQKAEEHIDTIMPGLTHTQHAQPISLAHHLMAYFWMLERDKGRLRDFKGRLNHCPLGAAALAGTRFPIDRQAVASELHFEGVSENSLDTVADRDFVIEFLSFASLMMIHLSRLSEEFIWWSSYEFQFLSLDDSVTTGSSIMPNKKNPDVAELIRGKTGTVSGQLFSALMMMKALPLSYNRDMQEDKSYVFNSLDQIKPALSLTRLMLESAQFHSEAMKKALEGDCSNATDLADYLAQKNLPFREAHEVVGRIVQESLDLKKPLENYSLKELQKHHNFFEEDVMNYLSHEAVMKARNSYGGTSPQEVSRQVSIAKAAITKAAIE